MSRSKLSVLAPKSPAAASGSEKAPARLWPASLAADSSDPPRASASAGSNAWVCLCRPLRVRRWRAEWADGETHPVSSERLARPVDGGLAVSDEGWTRVRGRLREGSRAGAGQCGGVGARIRAAASSARFARLLSVSSDGAARHAAERSRNTWSRSDVRPATREALLAEARLGRRGRWLGGQRVRSPEAALVPGPF
jgi:hypothetical protein